MKNTTKNETITLTNGWIVGYKVITGPGQKREAWRYVIHPASGSRTSRKKEAYFFTTREAAERCQQQNLPNDKIIDIKLPAAPVAPADTKIIIEDVITEDGGKNENGIKMSVIVFKTTAGDFYDALNKNNNRVLQEYKVFARREYPVYAESVANFLKKRKSKDNAIGREVVKENGELKIYLPPEKYMIKITKKSCGYRDMRKNITENSHLIYNPISGQRLGKIVVAENNKYIIHAYKAKCNEWMEWVDGLKCEGLEEAVKQISEARDNLIVEWCSVIHP